MDKHERHQAILKIIDDENAVTYKILSNKLNVCLRTIKYDVDYLSLTQPIQIIRGRYGSGVKLLKRKKSNKLSLNPTQYELILKVSRDLNENDLIVMQSILDIFELQLV